MTFLAGLIVGAVLTIAAGLLWAELSIRRDWRATPTADDTPDQIDRAIGIGGAADREGR